MSEERATQFAAMNAFLREVVTLLYQGYKFKFTRDGESYDELHGLLEDPSIAGGAENIARLYMIKNVDLDLCQQFAVGDRVTFTADKDVYPHVFVKQGDCGTVTENTNTSFAVELDKWHEGLKEWENCVMWLYEDIHHGTFPEVELQLTKRQKPSPHFQCHNCGAIHVLELVE